MNRRVTRTDPDIVFFVGKVVLILPIYIYASGANLFKLCSKPIFWGGYKQDFLHLI